jgi:hypothetical protein
MIEKIETAKTSIIFFDFLPEVHLRADSVVLLAYANIGRENLALKMLRTPVRTNEKAPKAHPKSNIYM